MAHPRVIVIVLNWNGKEDTIACIDSLHAVTYPNMGILVVDNGSSDGSVECLRGRYPGLEVIETGANLGFAGGNNAGIRRALETGADYLLLLNNDTVVDPGFLDGLVGVAESDGSIGIAGPLICFYSHPETVWSAGGKINMFTGDIGNVGEGRPRNEYRGIRRTGYVSGCALLIKAGVVKKIGPMDEDYFLYYEETDWNVKARRHGYASVVDGDVRILHKVGAKAGNMSDHSYYYTCRNLPLFIRKNGRWYHKLIFYPVFFAHYLAVFAFHRVRGDRQKSINVLRGLRDFLRHKYGPG